MEKHCAFIIHTNMRIIQLVIILHSPSTVHCFRENCCFVIIFTCWVGCVQQKLKGVKFDLFIFDFGATNLSSGCTMPSSMQ